MLDDFFKVNIGQVVSMLVFASGALGVWFKMKFKLESLEEKLKNQDAIVREFESKGVLLVIGQHEARITKLEALQETLNSMRVDIAVIKAAATKPKGALNDGSGT